MAEHILQWNCNGVKHHYCQLKQLCLDYSPYCFVLQETHLKPGETFALRGYTVVRHDVVPRARARGGVAVLVKQNLPHRDVHLNTTLQAVAVRLRYPLQLTVCSLYLPDNTWSLQDLQHLVTQLPRPFVLLGDYNAHNVMWGSDTTDARGRLIEQLVNTSRISILNTGSPTHFSARSRTFSHIDLSLSSSSVAHKFDWRSLSDLYFSDHFPLLLSAVLPTTTAVSPRRWLYHHVDWFRFASDIRLPPLSDDVNTAVQKFTTAVLTSASLHIPRSTGHIRRPTVPWWSDEIKRAIAAKNKAFNRFRRYPTDENLVTFKKLRAVARRLINTSKRSSWEQYVSSITCETTSTDMWQKIRKISGNFKSTTIHYLHQPQTNTSANTASEVSEMLAAHFAECSSFTKYQPPFSDYRALLETPLDFTPRQVHEYNELLTMSELQTELLKLKGTSPGPDNISNTMLQHLPHSALQHLLAVYNLIWTTHTFPDGWREAIVVPVPKPNKNSAQPTGYRPISLTSCLSKLLEKMINRRLMWLLENRSLLVHYQSGFRRYCSTIDHLATLETVIQNSFSKRHHTLAVFFDLEGAYDRTWRYGILRQLHTWGVEGHLPLFIEAFLQQRRFRVRVQDKLSSVHPLDIGIPQGSTLSVTLFAIAVNNLAETVTHQSVGRCLYVDDLAIYVSGNNMQTLTATLQTAIDNVKRQASSLGFTFNPEKTHAVHFCRRRICPDPQLYLDTCPVCTYSAFLGTSLRPQVELEVPPQHHQDPLYEVTQHHQDSVQHVLGQQHGQAPAGPPVSRPLKTGLRLCCLLLRPAVLHQDTRHNTQQRPEVVYWSPQVESS